jgi:hypothetical protein
MNTEKREAELKAKLFQELRRQHPRCIILQLATPGAPDRAVLAHGRTSYWEFKHGTPHFDAPYLQSLMCARMAVQGHCRYVIWQERSGGADKRTLIVHPLEVMNRAGWIVKPETHCDGFDIQWLIKQILKVHR